MVVAVRQSLDAATDATAFYNIVAERWRSAKRNPMMKCVRATKKLGTDAEESHPEYE